MKHPSHLSTGSKPALSKATGGTVFHRRNQAIGPPAGYIFSSPFTVEVGFSVNGSALGGCHHGTALDSAAGTWRCPYPGDPFSEIYLADTSQRSIGVGAYGGGLIVGTTLSSRYLELDLVNGDVVRIKADRPQVLHQRLNGPNGRPYEVV